MTLGIQLIDLGMNILSITAVVATVAAIDTNTTRIDISGIVLVVVSGCYRSRVAAVIVAVIIAVVVAMIGRLV